MGIFRDILWSLPQLLTGDLVISADELVPFFDWNTQFLDQIAGKFSPLTHGYEFRVRYSVLTTWMRYYQFLPFALLLCSVLCPLISTVAVSSLLINTWRHLSQQKLIVCTALTQSLLFAILFYAKVTHFYTLILGFSLFTVSLCLLLFAVCIGGNRPKRTLAISCILAALNPGVHYVVLFCITAAVVGLMTHRTSHLVLGTSRTGTLLVYTFLALLTILPYALFVKLFVLRGIGDLVETVPVSYYFIRNTSVPLFHLLSFDMAGIMDNMLQGDYLTPVPRYGNMFYSLVLLSLLGANAKRMLKTTEEQKHLIRILWMLMLTALWCSIGYSGWALFPSFHRTIAHIAQWLYVQEHSAFNALLSVIATVIQILRFPHRFQFIAFAVSAILLPLALLLMEKRIRRVVHNYASQRKIRIKRELSIVLVALFFLPLLCHWEYRTTFLSGNFQQFLQPYPLEHLQEMKETLEALPKGKTIVIPPSETSKRVRTQGGSVHKFIDKFYIYFLNAPSYYYGLSGDAENKQAFFLLFRALHYGQHWWINMVRDLQTQYLIVNKELGANYTGGREYVEGMESMAYKEAQRLNSELIPIHENTAFSLFQIRKTEQERTPLLIDSQWNSYVCMQESNLRLTTEYDLIPTTTKFFPDSHITVVSDDKERSLLDMFAKRNPERFFTPDSRILAFTKNQVPSSFYTGIIYSLFNLLELSPYNFLDLILPGTYGTLTGTFLGLPADTQVRIPVTVPEEGVYQLYLRGIFTKNTLTIHVGDHTFHKDIDTEGTTKYFRKELLFSQEKAAIDTETFTAAEAEALIPDVLVPRSVHYAYIPLGSFNMPEGTLWIELDKHDKNPMVLEGILSTASDTDITEQSLNVTIVHPSQFNP